MSPGIPTKYRSANFRSRLEARWAVFFDLIGWSWTYEPLDLDGYIPDFLIQGPASFLVEVGPCIDVDDYIAKGAKARKAFPVHLKLEGTPGDQVWEDAADRWVLVAGAAASLRGDYQGRPWRLTAAGIWHPGATESGVPRSAFWARCPECRDAFRIEYARIGTLGPCGHQSDDFEDHSHAIETLWNRAGSDVQWFPSVAA